MYVLDQKIRKLGKPLKTPILLKNIKVGFEGVIITRTCYPDEDSKRVCRKFSILGRSHSIKVISNCLH